MTFPYDSFSRDVIFMSMKGGGGGGASKGHGSIPCLMSQTDLHRIKSL